MSLGRDFRRLWLAFTVSAVGSAVGLGALPLIAVLALDVSTFQVSMLAALSAIGAVLGLPMGDFIEQRRKRPVMIAADLVRFVVLVSVPVAAAFDVLTYVAAVRGRRRAGGRDDRVPGGEWRALEGAGPGRGAGRGEQPVRADQLDHAERRAGDRRCAGQPGRRDRHAGGRRGVVPAVGDRHPADPAARADARTAGREGGRHRRVAVHPSSSRAARTVLELAAVRRAGDDDGAAADGVHAA